MFKMLKEVKKGREVIRRKKDSMKNNKAGLKKNQMETLKIKKRTSLGWRTSTGSPNNTQPITSGWED